MAKTPKHVKSSTSTREGGAPTPLPCMPACLPCCSSPSGPRQRCNSAFGACARMPQTTDRVFDEFLSFPKEETCLIRIVLNFKRPRVTERPINTPLKANFWDGFILFYSRILKEALGGKRRKISRKRPRTIVYVLIGLPSSFFFFSSIPLNSKCHQFLFLLCFSSCQAKFSIWLKGISEPQTCYVIDIRFLSSNLSIEVFYVLLHIVFLIFILLYFGGQLNRV